MALGAATPLWYLIQRAFEASPEELRALIFRQRTVDLLANTLQLLAIVGIGTAVIGYSIALLVCRLTLPGGRWWYLIAALPLAVPSYVMTYAMLSVNPRLSGLWPTAIALTLATFPYVTMPTIAALRRANWDLYDTARTLGASPLRAWAATVAPQTLGAAIAGVLLCVLYSLSDFAAPAMMRFQTLTVGVYGLFTGSIDRQAVAALSLVLVTLALFIVAVEQFTRRGLNKHTPRHTTHRDARIRPTRPVRVAALAALSAVYGAAIVFPLCVLFIKLFEGSRYASTWVDLWGAIVATLALGASAALLATVLAAPLAISGHRSRSMLTRLIEAFTFLGQALPGIVVALALVFASLRLTPWAYQTLSVLIAAYVILFLPKAVGSMRSSFDQVPPALAEVSMSLGRSRLHSWWSVVVPRAMPGIGAGGLIVMVSVMKEVPATLMLRPTGVDTLATELWSKTSIGAFGAAAPEALLLVLVGLIPAWIIGRSGVRP